MRLSHVLLLVTLLCFAAWVVFAFILAIPSGWVHVPLVAGILTIVRAIVAADDERAA